MTAPETVHPKDHPFQAGARQHHGKRRNHGEWIFIDFYAYNSRIRHWNPDFKVILSTFTLILCITLNNPWVSAAVIMAMAFLTIVKGKLPVHEYLSILAVPLSFILISVAAIMIDFSRQPLGQYNFYLGPGYVFTSQAMIHNGFLLMLKVFAAVSALMMMMLSTPSSEIISVLRKIHVPKIIIELMHLIYRYIFILMNVFVHMRNSADSRLGYCDLKTSWRTFGNIAGNMLVLSLNRASAYYDAMEARCYEGDLLFLEDEIKADKTQTIAAAAFLAALLLLWVLTK